MVVITLLLEIQFRGVILMRLEHAGKIQSASLISAADVEVGDDWIAHDEI